MKILIYISEIWRKIISGLGVQLIEEDPEPDTKTGPTGTLLEDKDEDGEADVP